MRQQILAINSAYFEAKITFEDYTAQARALLRPITNINQRVQWLNMLFVTV